MEQRRNARRRVRRGTNKCSTCVHAKHDETWGEYKCKLHQHRISKPDEYTDCKNYKKDSTKT